jgi:L-ribulose-5-phosphate 4-epimerase
MTDGNIKFNCNWQQEEFQFQKEIFIQLELTRAQLFTLGLIGIYPNGIGYGNISVRSAEEKSFIISGSATGGLEHLKQSDYALVTDYNINENTISCTGLTQASSESLTHAAIYQSIPEVSAVLHVHCLWLWEKLLKDYPVTSVEIEYGTPEMAVAVGKLALEMKDSEEKIIVMGGHHEGILVYGNTLEEARIQLFNIYYRYKI